MSIRLQKRMDEMAERLEAAEKRIDELERKKAPARSKKAETDAD